MEWEPIAFLIARGFVAASTRRAKQERKFLPAKESPVIQEVWNLG